MKDFHRILNTLSDRAEQLPKLTLRASVFFWSFPCLILIIKNTIYHDVIRGDLVFSIGLFLLCVLTGFNYVKPYHHTVDNISKTLSIAILILALKWLLALLVTKLPFVGNDPQGLSNVVYSTKETLFNLMQLPFIATGEEYFVWLVLLASLSLLGSHRKLSVIVAILLVSFMFGVMHVSYGITALLPIMATAIPSIAFSIYYRSILPAIIAHFLFDLVSFIGHWGENGAIITQMMITIGILVILISKHFRPIRT